MVESCGTEYILCTLVRLGRLHAASRTCAFKRFSKLGMKWMGGGEDGGHYRGLNTTSKAPEVGVSLWGLRNGAWPEALGADSHGESSGPCGILKAQQNKLINDTSLSGRENYKGLPLSCSHLYVLPDLIWLLTMNTCYFYNQKKWFFFPCYGGGEGNAKLSIWVCWVSNKGNPKAFLSEKSMIEIILQEAGTGET